MVADIQYSINKESGREILNFWLIEGSILHYNKHINWSPPSFFSKKDEK